MHEFWTARRAPVPTPVLVTSGVVGVLGGVLVVGHRPGLGVALLGVGAWAAAVPVLVRRRAVVDLLTLALVVALIGVVAVRDADWVVAVCVLVALGAAAVTITGARTGPAALLSPLAVAAGALRAVPWLRHGLGARAGARRDQVLVAVRSVAVTAGLLVVFGLLLSSADPVFASYLPRFSGPLLPARIAVAVVVAGVVATLAHLALAPPDWSRAQVPAGRPARRGEWLLPLVALDVLVLGFVAVQLAALRGGHAHVLETAGLSHAEYAREGFGQLVAVTALTVVVVTLAVRYAPGGGPRDALLVRLTLGALALGTLGVVASALRRMDLYVEAFGLTRLRVLATFGEVVLAVVVVLVVVAGLTSGRWLVRALVQVVAVAALTLAAVNPDAMILRHNAGADLEAGVDVAYLHGLSADAVPVAAGLDATWRSCLLDEAPAWSAAARAADPEARDGALGWNLGRARAADALEGSPSSRWSDERDVLRTTAVVGTTACREVAGGGR